MSYDNFKRMKDDGGKETGINNIIKFNEKFRFWILSYIHKIVNLYDHKLIILFYRIML